MKLYAVGIVWVCCLGACADRSCDLRAALTARAGSGATDCGHALLGASTAEIDACVVEAFGSHRAFFAQYDRTGTDSKISLGLARDGSGRVTLHTWDGDPSGGSGADPVISAITCESPSIEVSAER